jgi:hypothetical protein
MVSAKNMSAEFIIFFGIPPTYIILKNMGIKTDADEKSGSSKISIIGIDAAMDAVKSFETFFIWERFLEIYPAKYNMNAIFAISDGWNANLPKSNHDFEPRTRTPKKRTAIRSRIAKI